MFYNLDNVVQVKKYYKKLNSYYQYRAEKRFFFGLILNNPEGYFPCYGDYIFNSPYTEKEILKKGEKNKYVIEEKIVYENFHVCLFFNDGTNVCVYFNTEEEMKKEYEKILSMCINSYIIEGK